MFPGFLLLDFESAGVLFKSEIAFLSLRQDL
jgi:hypothetical protein